MSVLMPLECMKGRESSAWMAAAGCSTSPLQEKRKAHQRANVHVAMAILYDGRLFTLSNLEFHEPRFGEGYSEADKEVVFRNHTACFGVAT